MATDLCPSSMLDRLLAVLYDWSWNANLSPSLDQNPNQIRIGIDGSELCSERFTRTFSTSAHVLKETFLFVKPIF